MPWLPYKRASFEDAPVAEEDAAHRPPSRLRVFVPLNGGVMRLADRVTFRQSGRTVSPVVMSGIPRAQPVNFARAITGDVYFTNGLMPMMKWDGVRFTAQTVGVPPPLTALVMAPVLGANGHVVPTSPTLSVPMTMAVGGAISGSVSGGVSASLSGAINTGIIAAGTLVYVSSLKTTVVSGNLNGTLTASAVTFQADGTTTFTLSAPLTGKGSHTTISGIVYLQQFDGTSLQIGSFSGTMSGDSGVGTDVNGNDITPISGTYTAYQRFLDEEGNPSNLSPVSNEIVLTKATGITYSAVEVPTDPKIVRRQILRNTTGQAITYYVDVDTTDLSATTFSSTQGDETLQTNEAVPLFDASGNSLADRYTVPPTHKPVLLAYLDRMFAAGNVVYQDGHAEVTNGQATITGVGTQWTTALEGRFFYAVGGGSSYQIQTVDVATQTITLTGVYEEASDPFCVYVIQPPPAERNLVYFSEAGLPEAWPVTNALAVEETGDEVTALMSSDSFLYIFQRQRSYRLSYHQGPEVDGAIFPGARRGCINQRSWVNIDGAGYILDQLGVYKFDGGGGTEGLSAAIQDLFMLDRGVGGLHVNWNASRWFHASHSPDERSIRWFVALSGDRLPRHAIAWNYDSKFWWIEEYAFPVGSSALLDTPLLRPLVSGSARRVFAQGFGSLDGPDPAAGRTRAAVTSGLVDGFVGPAGIVYPVSGVVGSPVALYDGRGKGQVNIVAALVGATVRCVQPWLIQPDESSLFQLGGFLWTWQSGLYHWINEEGDEQRRVTVVYPPTATPAQCDLRFYLEFSATPDLYGADWPATPADVDSIRVMDGTGDAVIDLSYQYGFAQLRRAGRRERYIQKSDVFSIEVAGVAAEGPISIFEINVEGAE